MLTRTLSTTQRATGALLIGAGVFMLASWWPATVLLSAMGLHFVLFAEAGLDFVMM